MDERYDLILDMKNLRKVAFTLGFGLTVGYYTGAVINSVIDGSIKALFKYKAAHGSTVAQNACDNSGLSWREKSKQEQKQKPEQ